MRLSRRFSIRCRRKRRRKSWPALVQTLNKDESLHGILVQLPLPKHLDSEPIIQSILPEKDVDGLHVVNAGKVATGDLDGGLVSCTPAGAMVFVKPHARRGSVRPQRCRDRPLQPVRQADGTAAASPPMRR